MSETNLCPNCGKEISEMMYKISYLEDGIINKDSTEIQVATHTFDALCMDCCYLLPFKNMQEAMDFLNGLREE